jgi:hypothetical protein
MVEIKRQQQQAAAFLSDEDPAVPTLNDELLEILKTYADPIAPRRRPYFFEEVAEVQPRFLNAPPAIDEPPRRPSKPQPPRGPWRRRA